MPTGKTKFKWQKDRKAETEEKILRPLARNPSRFSDLLTSTELSRAVLSKMLRELSKQNLIEKFVAADGSVQYRLMGKAAQKALAYLRLAEFLAGTTSFFDPLRKMATDPGITVEKFMETLGRKIAAQALFSVISALTIEDPDEAKTWLRSTFGQPDQRREWVYYLVKRASFEAGKEVTMTWTELYDMERIPENVPRKMVENMWAFYRKLYPSEAKILDAAMNTADRYANVMRHLQKGELDKEKIDKMPFSGVLERYG